jgi:GntR family transcriptional regulator
VPGAAEPLHARLRQALRARVAAGELPPHAALPGERALMAAYGVSRATVREAIAALCREGVLYRVPRRGTFVAGPKFSETLGRLTGFAEELKARGLEPETTVLACTLAPGAEEETAALGLPPGASVLRVERLVRVGGVPLFCDRSALPAAIYTLLEQRGVRLGQAEQTIEAVTAGPVEAARLGVAAGAPLLRVGRLTRRAGDGRPVEVAVAHYRADRYAYRITLQRRP